MNKKRVYLIMVVLILLFGSGYVWWRQKKIDADSVITASTNPPVTVYGVVTNKRNQPLADVWVQVGNRGILTNASGEYLLTLTREEFLSRDKKSSFPLYFAFTSKDFTQKYALKDIGIEPPSIDLPVSLLPVSTNKNKLPNLGGVPSTYKLERRDFALNIP